MIQKYIEMSLSVIGLGIILHYYAFAIAWGVAKGWAKVIHQTTQVWQTSITPNKDK